MIDELQRTYVNIEKENNMLRKLFVALIGSDRDGIIQNIKRNFDDESELGQEIDSLDTEIQYLYNHIMNDINESLDIIYNYVIRTEKNMDDLVVRTNEITKMIKNGNDSIK